jgi:hypothetical protein
LACGCIDPTLVAFIASRFFAAWGFRAEWLAFAVWLWIASLRYEESA